MVSEKLFSCGSGEWRLFFYTCKFKKNNFFTKKNYLYNVHIKIIA